MCSIRLEFDTLSDGAGKQYDVSRQPMKIGTSLDLLISVKGDTGVMRVAWLEMVTTCSKNCLGLPLGTSTMVQVS